MAETRPLQSGEAGYGPERGSTLCSGLAMVLQTMVGLLCPLVIEAGLFWTSSLIPALSVVFSRHIPQTVRWFHIDAYETCSGGKTKSDLHSKHCLLKFVHGCHFGYISKSRLRHLEPSMHVLHHVPRIAYSISLDLRDSVADDP